MVPVYKSFSTAGWSVDYSLQDVWQDSCFFCDIFSSPSSSYFFQYRYLLGKFPGLSYQLPLWQHIYQILSPRVNLNPNGSQWLFKKKKHCQSIEFWMTSMLFLLPLTTVNLACYLPTDWLSRTLVIKVIEDLKETKKNIFSYISLYISGSMALFIYEDKFLFIFSLSLSFFF